MPTDEIFLSLDLAKEKVSLKQMEKINKTPCHTCPFAGRQPLNLEQSTRQNIVENVIRGINHLCHSDKSNKVVCRGGRDIYLRVAWMQGSISTPTDEALEAAMISEGIVPGSHINNNKQGEDK